MQLRRNFTDNSNIVITYFVPAGYVQMAYIVLRMTYFGAGNNSLISRRYAPESIANSFFIFDDSSEPVPLHADNWGGVYLRHIFPLCDEDKTYHITISRCERIESMTVQWLSNYESFTYSIYGSEGINPSANSSGYYPQGRAKITEITFNGLFENLISLDLSYAAIETLDVSTCINLNKLSTYCCVPLKNININGLDKLYSLNSKSNSLSEIDLSTNTALQTLIVENNKLSSLDISNNTQLSSLNAYGNLLTSITGLQNCTLLNYIEVSINRLTELDLSNNPELVTLNCYQNQLTELDLSNNPELVTLNCYYNLIEKVDLTKCTKLETLNISFNFLTNIDLTQNILLKYLDISRNNLTEIDITHNVELIKGTFEFYNRAWGYAYIKDGTTVTVAIYNNKFKTIDTSKNTKLQYFRCETSKLETLDLSANTELTTLLVGMSQIDQGASAKHNNLKTLDLTNNTKLITIDTWGNVNLSKIDISKCTELVYLSCGACALAELDISNNMKLTTLNAQAQFCSTIADNWAYTVNWDMPKMKVIGLSGIERDITYYSLSVTEGDYDFTKCTFPETGGCLFFMGTGNVKINESTQRGRTYNHSGALSSYWTIATKGNTEVYFNDGTVTTTKEAYYTKVASIVANENLYEYPQFNKIYYPVFDIEKTRDMYNIHKVLVCDSYQDCIHGAYNDWCRNYTTEYNYNYISSGCTPTMCAWTCNYSISGASPLKLRLVVKDNATFYISQTNVKTWNPTDIGNRLICTNGVLETKKDVSILSTTIDTENNQTEYIVQFDMSANGANGWTTNNFLQLFEDKYADAEDQYETRIVTFEQYVES